MMKQLQNQYDDWMLSIPGGATESETEEEVEEVLQAPWKLILYDDDIHTFDEVIEQLMKATGCGLSKAEELTWKVHNEGKAIVHEGEFEECLRIGQCPPSKTRWQFLL